MHVYIVIMKQCVKKSTYYEHLTIHMWSSKKQKANIEENQNDNKFRFLGITLENERLVKIFMVGRFEYCIILIKILV